MAASLVQEKLLVEIVSSTSARTVSFDSPVSSGNSVIFAFAQISGVASTGGNVITASDTGTGTYGTPVVDRADGNNQKRAAIFAKHNISSGGFTTITFQGSTTIGGRAALYEVSGLSSAVVTGSNDALSSAVAYSTALLTGVGFAVGCLAPGNVSDINTLEAGYSGSTLDGYMFVRGSSASQSFTNTQCTASITASITHVTALALFSETASAAAGVHSGLRLLFGVGR